MSLTSGQYEQLCGEGRCAESRGDFDTAAAKYIEAVRKDPQKLAAHFALQYLHTVSAERANSICDLYFELVEHFPDWHLVWGILGDALTHNGMREAAIRCYDTSAARTLHRRHGVILHNSSEWCRRGPDFIITGFSKCGTTSLFLYLRKHPAIITGHRKEIRYFTDHLSEGLDWYFAHFPPTLDEIAFVAGEATPSYATALGVAKLVAQLPTIPLCIFLLRNPVARTVSHYHQRRRNGLESRSLEETVTQEIALLESRGLDAESVRLAPYVGTSLYGCHIEIWRKYIPENKMLILRSEDLFADPKAVTGKVVSRLGLQPHNLPDMPAWNEGAYASPPARTVRMLQEFFDRAAPASVV